LIDVLPSISNILSELITGAIGGTIVAGIGLGYRIYSRRQIEAKFPVSGDYISFFEDIVEGEKVTVPSTAEIKQRGSSVRIINQQEDGRSWTLDGTILQGGHMSGVYSADAVYDEGVGSFYLRIGPNDLDGMWNGYDHVNKTTNAGRYWFRRILDAEVVEFSRSYLNDVLHTSTNAFGSGYVDRKSLEPGDGKFALVALVNGEFAGYCFGGVQTEHSIRSLLKNAPGILPDDVRLADEDGSLGLLKTVAIRRKFRSHGVGTRLVQAAEKQLHGLGAECIVVPAWKSHGTLPIGNLLRNNDYAEWLEVPDYWRRECENDEFECRSFSGGCNCSVIFFRKGRF